MTDSESERKMKVLPPRPAVPHPEHPDTTEIDEVCTICSAQFGAPHPYACPLRVISQFEAWGQRIIGVRANHNTHTYD